MSLRAIHRATCGPRTSGHQRLLYIKTTKGPQCHQRAFHASSPRLFLDECVYATHTVITGIHSSTGLPWAATLPLVAVLVRLTITGPIAVYGHTISNRRRELFPLLHAWRATITRNVMGTHKKEGPVACERIIARQAREKGAGVRKRMGVQFWKSSLTWIQVPVWLVVIDTIRNMCSMHHGLLGIFKSAPEKDVISEGDTVQPHVNHFFEPTLATEGALWFPDLLVPDPMLILPFTLSASLFGSIIFYERRTRAAGVPLSVWQIRLQRTIKIVALAMGPATLGMPSGILVYWISSSLCVLAQNVFLEWYIPSPVAIQPCKPKKMF